MVVTKTAPMRSHVRFRGQSGHGLVHCKCLLLTQSGHSQVTDVAISRIPNAVSTTPAMRESRWPDGTIFSDKTKMAIPAIHSTFMIPPTNNKAIRAQQQPTQYRPC